MDRKTAWSKYDDGMLRACMDFAEDYRIFLSTCKTERECVDFFVEEAEKNGYIDLREAAAQGRQLKPGDCVYSVWMNKTMILFRIGERPFAEGINILGAHIDSPRLDVKQNPLYEDGGLAYLDTHYYGGIKKYQYVTLPLAIHGVFVKKSGETVIVSVGEDEDDPVFFVSDLLIHISQEQMKKPLATGVEGEALDLIIGNRPIVLGDDEDKETNEERKTAKEAVCKAVLEILGREYGIEENDFESAELEIVPAGKARDAGFDRSMILGYGQDDRVCAYACFRAQMEVQDNARTTCSLFVDKEEIGSVGATSMQSRFFENTLADLMDLCGQYSDIALRRTLANSCMISSDVSSAFDPHYASSFEKKNAAFMGRGVSFNKYTGARGKSHANDANAEYIAHLRAIFEEAGVTWQTSEVGRVDLGGGGTISFILSLFGMNVIDSGVPVLSMHSPWEATSKCDIYEAFKGYAAFLRGASMRNI